jgi:AcrR family transcriptional regulator
MPQPPARTRRLTRAQRTELSDQRMIASAIRLIVEHGISATTLTDVGLKAGYSRGLAAMRFGTKGRLLSCIARHVTSSWISRLTVAVGAKTGLAAVLAAIDAQESALIEQPAEMRAVYAVFFQSSDPSADFRADVARSLAAQRSDLRKWFQEAREAGEISLLTDPSRIAGHIHSSMLGIVYQWMMDPNLSTQELHRGLKDLLGETFGLRSGNVARRRRPLSHVRK